MPSGTSVVITYFASVKLSLYNPVSESSIG